jgi:hypothetical protein
MPGTAAPSATRCVRSTSLNLDFDLTSTAFGGTTGALACARDLL